MHPDAPEKHTFLFSLAFILAFSSPRRAENDTLERNGIHVFQKLRERGGGGTGCCQMSVWESASTACVCVCGRILCMDYQRYRSGLRFRPRSFSCPLSLSPRLNVGCVCTPVLLTHPKSIKRSHSIVSTSTVVATFFFVHRWRPVWSNHEQRGWNVNKGWKEGWDENKSWLSFPRWVYRF